MAEELKTTTWWRVHHSSFGISVNPVEVSKVTGQCLWIVDRQSYYQRGFKESRVYKSTGEESYFPSEVEACRHAVSLLGVRRHGLLRQLMEVDKLLEEANAVIQKDGEDNQ